jgi:hypothetical protein
MVFSLPQVNNIMDLYAWMFVQTWFMPYYMLGKQDEWKKWMITSPNGIWAGNICKP